MLGMLSLTGVVIPIPMALPVFGLALGVNGLIKENRRTEKRRHVIVMSGIGIMINIVPAILFIF